MANYPNIPSPGTLLKVIDKFRSNFPSQVDIKTLKKLRLASGNESKVINTLSFIDILGEDGSSTEAGKDTFSKHKDEDFQQSIKSLVESAYQDLFNLHGDSTWKLDADDLISFFRESDKTGEMTGSRQAIAFATLATLSGTREKPGVNRAKAESDRKPSSKGESPVKSRAKPTQQPTQSEKPTTPPETHLVTNTGTVPGVTINIQLTLPTGMDQEGFDAFFSSMKKHLLL